MNKLGDGGTTPDGSTEQTRELMHGAEGNAVPMPLGATSTKGVDGTPSLSAKRKEEIREQSKKKMQFMEQEYWRLRNGKQNYMRCPYCVKSRHGRKRNFVDGEMCCGLFAKAFKAILDRQDQVDVAASHARNVMRLSQMAQQRVN